MTRKQIRITTLILVIALLVGIAFAANPISSAEKRKVAQRLLFAPTPPVADGEISAGDRAALAGVYSIYTTGEEEFLERFDRFDRPLDLRRTRYDF